MVVTTVDTQTKNIKIKYRTTYFGQKYDKY